MSTSCVAAYLEHGPHENNTFLQQPSSLGGLVKRDVTKRWGVLVEDDPDVESAEIRGVASKRWHWGRRWKYFAAETFSDNPKGATQPRLPCPPSAAIGQASGGDMAGRKPSLTRSNAIHRPRSQRSTSVLGIPGQADGLWHDGDPASPDPSLTCGESTADTPTEPLLLPSHDRFQGFLEQPGQLWERQEFGDIYFKPVADDIKHCILAPELSDERADETDRMALPARLLVETNTPKTLKEASRVAAPAKIEGEPVESAAVDSCVEELQARIRTLEAELQEKNNDLARKNVLVDGILENLRPADQTDGSSEPLAVAARVGSRMSQVNAFLESINGALTQRSILMLKYVQRQGDTAAPASAAAESQAFSSSPTPGLMWPTGDIDSPMNLTQAAEFAACLDTRQTLGAFGTLSVKFCRICHIPKFLNAPVHSPSSSEDGTGPALVPLNEFFSPTGVTTCCAKAICRSCFVAGLVAGAAADWWHNLGPERPVDGSLDWLRCPMPTCSKLLPRQQQQQQQPSGGPLPTVGALIAARLSTLGGADLTMHVFRFERASRLRAALESLTPRPTEQALAVAAGLHRHLVERGRMRDLFSTSVRVDDMRLCVLPVDSEDGGSTLRVPVFAGLFISPSTARASLCGASSSSSSPSSSSSSSSAGGSPAPYTTRECSICCEAVRDAADGTAEDEARWALAAAAFPGAWAASVRAFPTAAVVPACAERHALDACRACLARHFRAQLESRGRDAAGRLACPSEGCGHVYSHDEVRAILLPFVLSDGDSEGGEELFARYDRLCLLNHLSGIPGFMWCLREGCDNGQIHDVPDDNDDDNDNDNDHDNYGGNAYRWASAARHRVTCESCGFAMCARHQAAWHQGLTCCEWDDEVRGGGDGGEADPAEAASRRWIAANTKRCPGPRCGAPVQKGDGCFHMTCRRCRFEFCWECLADWSGIGQAHSRVGVLGGGHNAGCFFREANAPHPTQIRGTSAREAARQVQL